MRVSRALPLLTLATALLLLSACSTSGGDPTHDTTVDDAATTDTRAVLDVPVEEAAVDTGSPAPDATVPPEEVGSTEDTSASDLATPEDLLTVEDLPPTEDVPVDDAIYIPITELSTTASFFEYEGHKATIKYFAVLDGEGQVHVAFDACDVCYGAKLGYSQMGSVMVCNNCGNQFAISGIGTENKGGGCWPGFLEATITDTHLVIEPDILEAGSWYFE